MQHRDLVGDVLDEFHVVLDHQHRAVLDDLVQQLRGLDALADTHAGDRLVEHQEVRVLNQQHADLQPLLLAVAEQFRRHVETVLQEDHLGDFLDAVAHDGVALERQGAEHAPAAREGNLEILEHREVVIDRRGLEFAPDARLHDLVLLHLREVLVTKMDRTRRRLGLAADQIEHGGFAGTVGADDDADLVLLDIEGQVVDRLEAVERHGQSLDREQEILGLVADQHVDVLTLPGRRRRPRCRSSRSSSNPSCASAGRCAAARNRSRCRRGHSGTPAPRQ